ncbi:MAG: type II toxin-antitoxin system RelB/DinJ family antitoxin [Phascolarctobacterium sp.]|nr:type II toxin-antitoxin system RelB/DinJ family antitoxin [Candidatus Phascolarctobacterium caballi]
MAKVSTNLSLDPTLKIQAQKLFAELGFDLSTAVTVFFKQALRERKIPFQITMDIPTQTTVDALNEYEDMKKHEKNEYKRYGSFKEILREVAEEDAKYNKIKKI